MTLKLVPIEAAMQHVTASATCEHCLHEWVAVAVAQKNGDGPEELECPSCRKMSRAVRFTQVRKTVAIIDELREGMISGRFVAFAAVGIEPDDNTYMMCGATENVSRLRTIGAISALLHSFMHGD